MDEIVAEGTLFVLFTGGEVLVRPDFPELYLYARSQGLLVTIFTNGTLITDRIADLFAEHRPDKVEISLYGMTQETYERVTRVPGSFEKCLAGIRRLVERGVPLTLKTMALAWNHHEIEAMEAYAKSLGLVFRFDSSLNPRVDCGANRNSELQLDPERALELDLGSPERMEGFREFCETLHPARRRVRGGAGLHLRRRPELVHRRSLRAAADVPALAQELPRPEARAASPTAGTSLFPKLRARDLADERGLPQVQPDGALRQLPGRGRDGDGRHRGHRARLLRARAPAGLGRDGRGLGPPPRRDLLPRPRARSPSRPDAEARAALSGGCGSCGNAAPEPGEKLVRLERRPRRA